MARWRMMVFGAAAFVAAHFALVAGWAWFDPAGARTAWFLNSGRAVAFTALCLALAAAIAAAFVRGMQAERVGQGLAFGAGAAVAMAVILFSGRPGTLFPIVLAIGAAIALASGVVGAVAGGMIRSGLTSR